MITKKDIQDVCSALDGFTIRDGFTVMACDKNRVSSDYYEPKGDDARLLAFPDKSRRMERDLWGRVLKDDDTAKHGSGVGLGMTPAEDGALKLQPFFVQARAEGRVHLHSQTRGPNIVKNVEELKEAIAVHVSRYNDALAGDRVRGQLGLALS